MDDEIMREFLVESHENLDQLDQLLVELEEHPGSRERLAGIFRTIHTLKGTSGFLALGKLEAIAHVGETLLSKLRDGELTLDRERTDVLLRMVDTIRLHLRAIEATGREEDDDPAPLVAAITALSEREASPVVQRVAASAKDAGRARAPETVHPEAPSPAPAPKPTATARAEEPEEHADPRRGAADTSIRVDVQLLDRLMNLVGELVLARNQVLQVTAGFEDSGIQATSQRLNLVTTELQEGIMKTRMQPIGGLWG